MAYMLLATLLIEALMLVEGLNLKVATTGGNASSKTLYGFFFEDINHSGDGGIHAQLLRNNGFQGDSLDLSAYRAVGDATLGVGDRQSISSAVSHSLEVSVPEDALANASDNGDIYASKSIAVQSSSSAFTHYETKFDVSQASDGNNVWVLTFDAAKASGKSLYFTLISLYPETFNNRPNGLRPSIMEPLRDLNGSHLRFPGGNNLGGSDPSRRWKWEDTIGPLENRPGRQGMWGYPNTDNLGLLEFLLWCEDLDLLPVLIVWDGLSPSNETTEENMVAMSQMKLPISANELQPYVDDALNEIEYIRGATTTKYGALRKQHGHSEPFELSYIGLGNEDFLWAGGESYPTRFSQFYDAIHARYPDITLILSTWDYLPQPIPEGVWIDYHTYTDPDGLVEQFNVFDNVGRDVPYYVGEYSAYRINGGEWFSQPVMQASVAEAVFLMGIERNSDIVKMTSYAPLLGRTNATQWTPNFIDFNNNPDGVVLSTSYYVHQLFFHNKGDTVVRVDADQSFGPAYWTASKNSTHYIVKVGNYGFDKDKVSVTLLQRPGDPPLWSTSTGVLSLVSGSRWARNTYDSMEVGPPRITNVDPEDGSYVFDLPGWAVGVLAFERGYY